MLRARQRVKRVVVLLAACGVLGTAQRAKPVYDPETKEGLLIQHIQQETDATEKLHYLEMFALQYPSNPSIAWVYDQLQPAYMRVKAWDEAMRIGEKRVALEAQNLDAAKLALNAAESKGNADEIARWADWTWKIASEIIAKGGPGAADAEQSKLYAESSLYAAAERTADAQARLGLLLAFQQKYPKSPFGENIPAECMGLYKKLNQTDKALALGTETLAADPDNIDVLMEIAQYYFAKEDHQKVISDSTRAIEALEKKPRPASMSEDDWQKKRLRLLGTANYMGGVSSSLAGQYGRADQMLRASLPFVASDATQEATVFYFLGLTNYKLADKEPRRAQEAVNYWRRCAAIKSQFQAQAVKNVEATRSEFSLP